MKQSEKNKMVIENFILYYTHVNSDEAQGEALNMYEALENYIQEDHVDGIDADINEHRIFNVLELASELADKKLVETYEGEPYKEIDGDLRYTEDAQDYFNDVYSEYYDFLIRIN